ncbi:MAG TPA: hypothetical protein VGE07_29345, partial [Herpetosiphonaceae bacterium]
MIAASLEGSRAGWLRRRWPLLAALALLAVLALWTLAAGLRLSGGRLVYALDDAYIHLAVARSLAEHGVWGLTRYEFSSSSSSLLWTLLLAAGLRLGAGDWLPLLLNLAAAAGLTVGMDRALRHDGWPPLARAAALAALLLAAGITALIFSGMEHTLQLGLALWLMRLASADLARSREVPPWQIGLLALLNVMVRYEGLFLAALIGLGYLLQRRWGRIALVGAAAALPVVVFGLVASGNGWPFLPASVVAKTQSLQQARFPLLPHFSGGKLTLRSVACLVLSLGWLAGALPRLRAGADRRWASFHALAAGALL